MVGSQLAEDWLKTTVQSSFGGEAKQLGAYRKLQSSRAEQADERAPTPLVEKFKDRLTDAMLTRLREDRDPETIFEFENDACRCSCNVLKNAACHHRVYRLLEIRIRRIAVKSHTAALWGESKLLYSLLLPYPRCPVGESLHVSVSV